MTILRTAVSSRAGGENERKDVMAVRVSSAMSRPVDLKSGPSACYSDCDTSKTTNSTHSGNHHDDYKNKQDDYKAAGSKALFFKHEKRGSFDKENIDEAIQQARQNRHRVRNSRAEKERRKRDSALLRKKMEEILGSDIEYECDFSSSDFSTSSTPDDAPTNNRSASPKKKKNSLSNYIQSPGKRMSQGRRKSRNSTNKSIGTSSTTTTKKQSNSGKKEKKWADGVRRNSEASAERRSRRPRRKRLSRSKSAERGDSKPDKSDEHSLIPISDGRPRRFMRRLSTGDINEKAQPLLAPNSEGKPKRRFLRRLSTGNINETSQPNFSAQSKCRRGNRHSTGSNVDLQKNTSNLVDSLALSHRIPPPVTAKNDLVDSLALSHRVPPSPIKSPYNILNDPKYKLSAGSYSDRLMLAVESCDSLGSLKKYLREDGGVGNDFSSLEIPFFDEAKSKEDGEKLVGDASNKRKKQQRRLSIGESVAKSVKNTTRMIGKQISKIAPASAPKPTMTHLPLDDTINSVSSCISQEDDEDIVVPLKPPSRLVPLRTPSGISKGRQVALKSPSGRGPRKEYISKETISNKNNEFVEYTTQKIPQLNPKQAESLDGNDKKQDNGEMTRRKSILKANSKNDCKKNSDNSKKKTFLQLETSIHGDLSCGFSDLGSTSLGSSTRETPIVTCAYKQYSVDLPDDSDEDEDTSIDTSFFHSAIGRQGHHNCDSTITDDEKKEDSLNTSITDSCEQADTSDIRDKQLIPQRSQLDACKQASILRDHSHNSSVSTLPTLPTSSRRSRSKNLVFTSPFIQNEYDRQNQHQDKAATKKAATNEMDMQTLPLNDVEIYTEETDSKAIGTFSKSPSKTKESKKNGRLGTPKKSREETDSKAIRTFSKSPSKTKQSKKMGRHGTPKKTRHGTPKKSREHHTPVDSDVDVSSELFKLLKKENGKCNKGSEKRKEGKADRADHTKETQKMNQNHAIINLNITVSADPEDEFSEISAPSRKLERPKADPFKASVVSKSENNSSDRKKSPGRHRASTNSTARKTDSFEVSENSKTGHTSRPRATSLGKYEPNRNKSEDVEKRRPRGNSVSGRSSKQKQSKSTKDKKSRHQRRRSRSSGGRNEGDNARAASEKVSVIQVEKKQTCLSTSI